MSSQSEFLNPGIEIAIVQKHVDKNKTFDSDWII